MFETVPKLRDERQPFRGRQTNYLVRSEQFHASQRTENTGGRQGFRKCSRRSGVLLFTLYFCKSGRPLSHCGRKRSIGKFFGGMFGGQMLEPFVLRLSLWDQDPAR